MTFNIEDILTTEDVRPVLKMASDAYAHPSIPLSFTAGEFAFRWYTETGPVRPPVARLWLDQSGRRRGFAWLNGNDLLTVYLTRTRQAEIIDAMLTWAERTQGEAAGSGTGTNLVRAWAFGQDDPSVEILQRRGYQRVDTTLVVRARWLNTSIPRPKPPPGYVIRNLVDGHDIEQRAAAYRAAFAPEEMTPGMHHAVMRASNYQLDLDLIAVAEDDTVAAFATVWYDPDNCIGTFEPVGCHPAHQRRGLARALMYEGMERLRYFGARRAFVSTTTDRLAANRLYESTGFEVIGRKVAWEKRV